MNIKVKYTLDLLEEGGAVQYSYQDLVLGGATQLSHLCQHAAHYTIHTSH